MADGDRVSRRVELHPKTYLKLAAPASGRIDYTDVTCPGFYLRVSSTGARTFAIRYRLNGSTPQRYTLGSCPPLELGPTRTRAKYLLGAVKLAGRHPADVEAEERGDTPPTTGPTLADLAAAYIEAREQDPEKPLAKSTAREYRALLKRHFKGDALAGPAASIARATVKDYLRKVVADSGRTEANRIFALGRATCRWALDDDQLERHPFEGLKRPAAEQSRERVLSAAEVAVLWKATEPKVKIPKQDKPELCPPAHAAAVRLQLLLGQRPTETLLMRREDVDLKGKRWTIPASFRKGKRTQVVPLSSAAVAIIKKRLDAIPKNASRVLQGASTANWLRWWQPIVDRTVKLGDQGAQAFTRHDLRRSCATGCASLGAPPHVVSRILGHRVNAGTVAVTGIYDRFDRMPEIASALEAWGSRVLEIASGRSSGHGRLLAYRRLG